MEAGEWHGERRTVGEIEGQIIGGGLHAVHSEGPERRSRSGGKVILTPDLTDGSVLPSPRYCPATPSKVDGTNANNEKRSHGVSTLPNDAIGALWKRRTGCDS